MSDAVDMVILRPCRVLGKSLGVGKIAKVPRKAVQYMLGTGKAAMPDSDEAKASKGKSKSVND